MSYPVYSLESFLSFAQSKDPNESYSYWSVHSCACAQYCRSRGIEYDSRVSHHGLENIACGDDDPEAWTFGQLVDRIKAEIAVRRADTI